MPAAPRRPAPARGRTTRGPLPASVYWRRRVFVLGTAFAVVFVIARWLTGSSDGSSEDAAGAEQAVARVEATGTVTAGAEEESASEATPRRGGTASASPTLAAPQGTCQAADVTVTPVVPKPAEAGHDVRVRLSLRTTESEACTWQVSRSSVSVRIADGSRVLWTTQHCPRVVPDQSVVVRRAVATVVEMTWNARESAARCARRTAWVMPGEYTISAAALGGEPAAADFELVRPAPRTVEVTPESTGTAKPKGTATKKPKKPVN